MSIMFGMGTGVRGIGFAGQRNRLFGSAVAFLVEVDSPFLC